MWIGLTGDIIFDAGHLIAGRYRVLRRLGMGGMGAVYEAEHLELGRRVAVKVLLPQLSRSGDMAARFMREARSAAQIGHPGIVQVFDLGVDGQAPFLVMEKLEGEELATRIEAGHPLPVAWVVKMGIELCDALQAAHDHGIVHRDLKPPNVFLARQGKHRDIVKVLDFGIAKLMQGADDIQTRTGQVFGTPMYMAPEQLRDSKDVDGRADVYGIGCILFQALVGKPPFEATTYPDLVFRICSGPRPSVIDLRGDVPRALDEVVARAMALQPQDRFASPGDLAVALGSPQQARSLPSAPGSLPSGPSELSSAGALTPHSQTTPPKQRSLLGSSVSAAVAVGVLGAGLGALWLWSPSEVLPSASATERAPGPDLHAALAGSVPVVTASVSAVAPATAARSVSPSAAPNATAPVGALTRPSRLRPQPVTVTAPVTQPSSKPPEPAPRVVPPPLVQP